MKRITAVLLVVMMIITTLSPVGAIGFVGVESSEEKNSVTTETNNKASLTSVNTVVLGASEVYSDVPSGAQVDVGTTEAIYDSAAGTVTGAGYAGTVTITNGEDVTNIIFCAPTKWKPGLNVLTGTADAMDFDSDVIDEIYAKTFTTTGTGGLTGIAVDPANDANKVLRLYGSAATDSIPEAITKTTFNPTIETSRPLTVSFKYKGTLKNLWAMINGRSGSTDIFKEAHNSTSATVASFVNFKYTGKPAYAVKAVGVEGYASSTNNVYVDDLSFVPSYKISYADDSTGSVAGYTYDYALLDAQGNILTEYAPLKTNYPAYLDDGNGAILKCIGWSTEEWDDTPMTAVPLENKDITLYPVWADYEIFDFKTQVMDANSTLTLNVVNTNALFTVDAGYSEAEFDETTYTLSGKGYAGKVTITGTDGDVTETKTVYLANATKWKPGLNVLTGTENALDFDADVIDEIYAASFTTTGGNGLSGIASDPENDANKVLKLYGATTGNSYPEAITKAVFNPTIETSRPLTASFKYKGNVANLWAMINGRSSATDKFRDVHDGTAETLSSFADFSYTGKPAYAVKTVGVEGLASSEKNVYVDDLSYVPGYKITYLAYHDYNTVAYTDYVSGTEKTYIPDATKVPGASGFATSQGGEQVAIVNLDHEDITLYPLDEMKVNYADGTNGASDDLISGQDYTIPKPSDVSDKMTDTNFVCWLDVDGNKYNTGDVIASTDLISKLFGKTLTAFYQDMTKPAMGYAFEGTALCSSTDNTFSYKENTTDDGRTVLHINQYKSSWTGSLWKNDNRVFFRTSDAFDTNEYTLIQYMYRIDNLSDAVTSSSQTSEGKDKTSAAFRFFYFPYNTATGYITGGVHQIGGNLNINASDEYAQMTFDMSVASNCSTTWTKTGVGYGFAMDPGRSTYTSDYYIDYLRVYRKGISTVTYNTNAPTGAEVIKNVDAETGRGVGTGYLLTGVRPEVQGYTFLGWALTDNASKADVVSSVDLKGDLTVYAVWETSDNTSSLTTQNTSSIRTSAAGNGIRFRASIADAQKSFVTEYGFIVSRAEILDLYGYTADELTFESRKPGTQTPIYVYGCSYSEAEGIDKIYELGENETIFTGVLTNIPLEYKNEQFVVRAYVKYTDGNGVSTTVYGNTVSRSIYDVANAIYTAGGDDYINNKEYIDEILDVKKN